jgi:hypothetical protein
LRRFLQGKFNGAAFRRTDSDIDYRLRIATVLALRQVGDGSFIEVVEDLANGVYHRQLQPGTEIQAAAKECLPYLQQRKLDAIASNELVRASNANSVGGADILLRPVASTQDLHEAELLRAGESLPAEQVEH